MNKFAPVPTAPHTIQGEYRISLAWSIFSHIIFFILIGFGSYLIYAAYKTSGHTEQFFLALCATLCILSSTLGLLSLRRDRLIIAANEIVRISTFRTHRLFLSDIDSVELDKNYLVFYPKDERHDSISFSRYYRDFPKVLAWAYETFDDLQQRRRVEDKRRFAQDIRLGRDAAERGRTIQRLRWLLRVLRFASWGVGLWLVFASDYYPAWGIAIATILPLIAVSVYLRYRGGVKLYVEEESQYPSVSVPLFVPTGGLVITSLSDINVLSYGAFWLPWIGATLVLLIPIIVRVQRHEVIKSVDYYIEQFVVLLFCASYAYAVTLIYNKALDTSPPTTYYTTVRDKFETKSRRGKSYHLDLAPWEGADEGDECLVSKRRYNRISVGEPITIQVYSGFLGIPYYDISW